MQHAPTPAQTLDYRFCLAPMMDWSDRHCRFFWRLLTKRARLYTEMITSGALLHGDVDYHLNYSSEEHPIAVQLGGSDPRDLAKAAVLCEQFGYDEVNLNVGCPSERVKSGAFGASLMHEPTRVAECIAAMSEAVEIPVTIKCRTGVDNRDSYEALCEFVAINRKAGCNTFLVHARKAWLSGLSPKQNREIPPLNYPTVFRLKQDFPALTIVLNGGLKTLETCSEALSQLDGVMIGREAYQNPYMLEQVDKMLFHDEQACQSRLDIAERFSDYVESQLAEGLRLNHLTRHILGLFNGVPGAKKWRRFLSEHAHRTDAGIEVYQQALSIARQCHLS